MANVKKNLRVQDTDIKRLNHVGLGLKAIADLLGCHAATVTLRLKAMGVDPTDTRRSFMEQVFMSLTPAEQEWLSHNLYNAEIGIKEFVTTLVKEAYANAPIVAAAVPAPMPELLTGEPGMISAELLQEAASMPNCLTSEIEVDPTTVLIEPERLLEVAEAPSTESAPAKPVSLFG